MFIILFSVQIPSRLLSLAYMAFISLNMIDFILLNPVNYFFWDCMHLSVWSFLWLTIGIYLDCGNLCYSVHPLSMYIWTTTSYSQFYNNCYCAATGRSCSLQPCMTLVTIPWLIILFLNYQYINIDSCE